MRWFRSTEPILHYSREISFYFIAISPDRFFGCDFFSKQKKNIYSVFYFVMRKYLFCSSKTFPRSVRWPPRRPPAWPERELGSHLRPLLPTDCSRSEGRADAGLPVACRLTVPFSELAGEHARVQDEDEAVAGEDDQLRHHRGSDLARPGEGLVRCYSITANWNPLKSCT